MNCADMKLGDSLVCDECGLRLEVTEECSECGEDAGACCVGPCTFSCCDKELTLQKA
ncbi:MAG: hypothetical protein IBX61_07455 [Thermoleophilia bacterium]|nr:hypothetical protein [Thermoleophilia bacterium]